MRDRIHPQRRYDYDRLLIGGQWVEPAGDRVFEVRSPHDGRLIGRTPEAEQGDVDRAVVAARRAFDEGPWPRMSPTERAAVIARFAAIHRAQADEKAIGTGLTV